MSAFIAKIEISTEHSLTANICVRNLQRYEVEQSSCLDFSDLPSDIREAIYKWVNS